MDEEEAAVLIAGLILPSMLVLQIQALTYYLLPLSIYMMPVTMYLSMWGNIFRLTSNGIGKGISPASLIAPFLAITIFH